MSYQTSVTYVAALGQTQFDVTFPYLDASHVQVSVSSAPAGYRWINPTRVELVVAPAAGAAVVIRRNTPIDQALVTFQNGAVLTKEELNTAVLQVLYIQQELTDHYSSTLDAAVIRLGDNLGIVTDPQSVMDELAQMALAGELVKDLEARLAAIDLNAQAIIKNALHGHELKQGLTVVQGQVTDVTTATDRTVSILNLLALADPDGQSVVLREDTVKRANGESLADAFASIQASLDSVSAAVTSEQQARATADTAEATSRQQLAAQVATNGAAVQTLSTAQASTSGSLAQLQQTLGAYNGPNGSWIMNDFTVKLSNGSTQAQAFSGILSRMGAAEAGIVLSNTAIATETSARAEAISGVYTQLNGVATSVTTVASVQAGQSAKYGVALDVNNYITGFVQNNDGRRGDFTVIANVFSVVDPNQGAPIVPFEVSGGVLRAPHIVAGDVFANTITANHIVDLSLTTPKLADNAVTNGASAFSQSQVQTTPGTTVVLQNCGMTTGSGRVQIAFSSYLNPVAFPYGGDTASQMNLVYFNTYRDGSLIATHLAGAAARLPGGDYLLPGGLAAFVINDTPGAGFHWYEVQAATVWDASISVNYAFDSRGLNLLETKK